MVNVKEFTGMTHHTIYSTRPSFFSRRFPTVEHLAVIAAVIESSGNA